MLYRMPEKQCPCLRNQVGRAIDTGQASVQLPVLYPMGPRSPSCLNSPPTSVYTFWPLEERLYAPTDRESFRDLASGRRLPPTPNWGVLRLLFSIGSPMPREDSGGGVPFTSPAERQQYFP